MSKYIPAALFNKYAKHIDGLEKKTTLDALWNAVCDKYNVEASIIVDLKCAKIVFALNGTEHTVTRDKDVVRVISSSGDAREENYDVLIKNALDYIIENKLLKTKRKRKN